MSQKLFGYWKTMANICDTRGKGKKKEKKKNDASYRRPEMYKSPFWFHADSKLIVAKKKEKKETDSNGHVNLNDVPLI